VAGYKLTKFIKATNIKDLISIENQAEKFLSDSKTGGLKYGKYSTLHLLHIKQIEEIKDKLDFKM